MKKYVIIALACAISLGAGAQNVYDAATIAQNELNGTARFVGMGGAMGALGGDISTIGTNPAGIGIYRSSEAMVSFGYTSTGTESEYVGSVFETDKNRWSFDNVGAVISTKVGNLTPLRYVNFGFNYHKAKSFYRNMAMEGYMGMADINGRQVPLSQVRYMAQQATNNQYYLSGVTGGEEWFDFGSDNIFDDADAGWLGALGYQGWLTNDGESPYYYLPVVPSEAYGSYYAQERGGVDQYDFNISFNINDRVYLGVTVGAYSVDYNKYSYYGESYKETGEDYGLESYKRIHGSGFNAKFGAIVRPFEYSSFRMGLAVHTPTYYNLTYTGGASLASRVLIYDSETGQESMEKYVSDTYQALGADMEYNFQLQTPWLVNASLGYTIGTNVALGAEYEYEDYGNMKIKDAGGFVKEDETNEVQLCLKAVHTLRLGAEWKVIPSFSLRAGYNYSSALFDDLALKYLPDNSIETDTDYANTKSLNTFTLGIGYRNSFFFADLAYKYQMQKADFYPFFNELSTEAAHEYVVNGDTYDSQLWEPVATKVTNSRSQVVLTLGFRF